MPPAPLPSVEFEPLEGTTTQPTETSISLAHLEMQIKKAREEALQNALLHERKRENALLESIAEQLKSDRQTLTKTIANATRAKADIALAITKRFCHGAALSHLDDIAIDLIDQFLTKAPTELNAVFRHSPSNQDAIEKIKAYLEEKNLCERISLSLIHI